MYEYHPRTEKTNQLHGQVITICRNLKTHYASKKHGGYAIYEDDKVVLTLDTYVSNVNACVKLPDGKEERVFSCNYSGGQVTYHKGAWEDYLTKLYQKAVVVENAKKAREEIERKKSALKAKEPCSDEANAIFA